MLRAESRRNQRRWRAATSPFISGSPRFRTREHGPLLVTDAWFPPGLTLPPHEHERAVIAVTLAGAWDSVMLRRPHDCAAGTLLIEPAGERHSNHFGAAGARVVILQPDLSSRGDLEPARRGVRQPVTFGSGPARAIASRIRAEIDAPDAVTPLALEALCFELLVVAARRPDTVERRVPRWLAHVVDHLHAHAREPLTLAALAAIGGVHPAHLAREFRRHHGTSVAAYVRALRLAWAAERLAGSAQPIADIAAEAGFADQSHFTRAFHLHAGRTPRQFRAAATA